MRRRSGFTLVEVLVAMALILFIMSILAAAFGTATSAASDLKSAGDLAERLRGAANVIKRDLEQDHFTASAASGPRLSDSTFWNRLNAGQTPIGFLRIIEGAIPPSQAANPAVAQGAFDEGPDLDGLHSFRATRTALHYTVALHGTRRSDFLSALVPAGSPLITPQPTPTASDLLLLPTDARYQDTANTYNSQFAEVAVFLARIPTYDATDGTNGLTPLPLYGLYRRQFLTVPNTWTPPAPFADTSPPQYLEMSTVPTAGELPAGGALTFNSMQDLTQPMKRFWMNRTSPEGAYQNVPVGITPAPPAGYDTTEYNRYANMGESNATFQNADLLLSDVVSFDVRVLIAGDSDFRDLFDNVVQAYAPIPPNPAFAGLNTPRVFDTWTNQGAYAATWNNPWQPVVAPATAPPAAVASTVPLYKNSLGAPIIIKAIQITLRVWDFKTKKTRQMTIVQEM